MRAIATAVREVLHSPEWLHTLTDADQATWLLTRSICNNLYLEGVPGIPSDASLREQLDRHRRNQAIIAAFTGTNYDELARDHKISTRQVRRIIERARQK